MVEAMIVSGKLTSKLSRSCEGMMWASVKFRSGNWALQAPRVVFALSGVSKPVTATIVFSGIVAKLASMSLDFEEARTNRGPSPFDVSSNLVPKWLKLTSSPTVDTPLKLVDDSSVSFGGVGTSSPVTGSHTFCPIASS